jgi:cellulose synthase/poly-beta-1,6-N-acetylglucosamine synthase-like glycosyltransferase
MKKRASVIIPVFNEEKNIPDCLNSLLNQSLKHSQYEIIVIDDGSTDNTDKIIEENFSNSVKLIKQNKKGPAAARNKGAELAESDIIVFTDADCELDANWLREMIIPIEKQNVDGVQGRYKSKQNNIVARFTQHEIEQRYKLLNRKKYIDFVSTYSAAYKKEVFMSVGGFNTDYKISSGEDTELSYKLQKQGYKMIFNQNAICYHHHPESLLDYLRTKFYRGFWRILLYRNHKSKIAKDSYTPFFLKLQVVMVLLVPALMPLLNYRFMLVYLFCFFSSMFGFVFFILKQDLIIGLLAPFFIILRAAAIALGLVSGFLKLFVIDKLLYKKKDVTA